jgi:cytochrome c5
MIHPLCPDSVDVNGAPQARACAGSDTHGDGTRLGAPVGTHAVLQAGMAQTRRRLLKRARKILAHAGFSVWGTFILSALWYFLLVWRKELAMKSTHMICATLVVTVLVVAGAAACGGEQAPPVVSPVVESTPTMVPSPAAETPAVEMSPTAAASAAPPAELSGEELLQARCTGCHTLDRVQAAGKTEAEWEATVERMRGNGAQLTDGEAQILVQYLAETYGP